MLIHLSQFLHQGSINERKGLVKYKCLNWYVEEEEKEQQEIFDENIFLCHRNNNKPQSSPTYAHKVSSSSTSSTPQITWYSYILSSCSVVCFLWTDEGTHNSISPKLSSPAVHKWRIGLSFYEFAQGTRRCDGTQQQTTGRQLLVDRGNSRTESHTWQGLLFHNIWIAKQIEIREVQWMRRRRRREWCSDQYLRIHISSSNSLFGNVIHVVH